MKTGAVILTAGKSAVPKGDLLGKELDTLREAGISPIVVVTGYEEDGVRRMLAHRKVQFVSNPDHSKASMFNSIRLGLGKIKGQCGRALIVNGDTPLFSRETIEALSSVSADAVFPDYRGRTGHPFCLDMRIADRIMEYEGSGGIRGMIRDGLITPQNIPVEDPGIHMEADGEESLKEAVRYQKEVVLSDPVRAEIGFGIARRNVFFDEDLAALLKEIDRCRSMNRACRKLGMAYSRAWKMIRRAEEMLGRRLVQKQAGGSGGGGSVLTEEGQKMLAGYLKTREDIQQYAEASLKRFMENQGF